MDHVFVYGPSSDVKRSPFCGPHIADLQTGPVRQDLPICEDKKTMLYAQQSLQQIGGEKPDIILIEEFP